MRDDQMVGYVRLAEYAFSLGRSIAYGYVRGPEGGRITKKFLSSGTWQLEVMGKRFPASLHLRPPFDPQNLRVKGIYGEKLAGNKVSGWRTGAFFGSQHSV